MCYKGNNYTLVNRKRNWCQALQHCRSYFTDLVSISNDTENTEVIEKGNGTSFWIGLLHDTWEWEDKSCSTFRKWDNPSGGNRGYTTFRWDSMYKTSGEKGIEYHFLCSKGDVRIKVINETLTWEEAFDYCKEYHTGLLWIEDDKDQEAVNQWLHNTDVRGPFWIGLRQSQVFGFWFWTSDRPVTYSNWRNDTVPEMPLSNHCGVINKMEDNKWSDENCLVPLPFLCEEEIFIMN
ncbi:C-type lectin BML-1-like [Pempheris klunzingeri]|uniref:C-type lectin BML-1-like n=1 Tax=Pempheris klunzingeri TaxID=3127111 RepID=UPI00398006FD